MPDFAKPELFPPIHRADRFVVSVQLEAFCIALRLAVQTQGQAGNVTITLLKKLREDVMAIVSGRCKVNLPDVDESASMVDLLALAETLRGTIGAFLTPDESEEQRGVFGFAPKG